MAKRGSARRKWIVAAVVVAVLSGAGFLLRGAFHKPATLDASKMAVVERGDIARSVVATGKIQPRAKVEVKSKASGIVKKILVDYGQFVRQGQVLVELDKEELQARMREASATLQAAQAAEESALAQHERNKVEAEGPDLPFLKSAMERARSAHQQGLISKAVMEEAERSYIMAFNKQASSLRSVSVTQAEIAKSRAQVAQAKAVLERAEEDLRNATIVSSMDGLVLSRNVEIGDAVSSILVLGSQATLVMTLGDVSDVYVLGKVDQSDIGRVYMGQKARIVVESFKDKKLEGAVTKIAPLGVEKDNVTTFEVRVSIRNPGGELRANMSANAEILLQEKKAVLLVPETSLVYDKQRQAAVEVPDTAVPGGKRKVPVQVGISNGVKTEITAGLTEGQQVVLQ